MTQARIIHIKSREEWLHPETYAPVDYDRSAIYRSDAEFDRIEQLVRLCRKEAWQFRVKISCIALAGFIVCGIIAQFSRGWF